MRLQPRTFTGFECDHLRPVVRVEDGWAHILSCGEVSEILCGAGIYKVEATYVGDHPIVELVIRDV